MKRESQFQHALINKIKSRFPGCIVMKNDANYIQGIPDWLVLYKDRWAALECKRSATESHRPNQDYYVELMDSMSCAKFVYPENEEEVLDVLEETFGT
jgi:DNA polymerase III epsilon subunit-like protein